MFVTDFLIDHFPDLMDVKFTAQMEAELDKISQGEQQWLEALRNFYELLKKTLRREKKQKQLRAKAFLPKKNVLSVVNPWSLKWALMDNLRLVRPFLPVNSRKA